MTEIIRTEAPRESVTALVFIYILTAFLLFFGGLITVGIVLGWSVAWISVWIGVTFFDMAVIVDLYRKNFQPDEMLAKTRLVKVVPRRELRE